MLRILSWFFLEVLQTNGGFNLLYQIDGGHNWIGDTAFLKEMDEKFTH